MSQAITILGCGSSGGVPRGTTIGKNSSNTTPGMPATSALGTSGSAGLR